MNLVVVCDLVGGRSGLTVEEPQRLGVVVRSLEERAGVGKASTIWFYTDHLENHIYPLLGDTAIGDISRRHVNVFIAALRGKRNKQGARLTHKTLVGIVRTLSTILSAAVEEELLPANPAMRPGGI